MEYIDQLDEKLDDAFDLMKRQRLGDAMAAVERCLDEDPTHAGAHALRGYILVLQNQLDDAEAAAARALSLDLDLAVAHFVSAIVERARGEPIRAVASYQRAIELEPEDIGYQIELAETYLEAGRGTEGRALLEEIKKVDPFGVEVLLLRAHVASLDGDPDEAVSCAVAAVKLEPQNPGARLALARTYLAGEQLEKAADHASQALVLDPGNWDALLLLTETLTQQGEYDAALAAIDKHAGDASNAEIFQSERARILLQSGRLEAAKAAIDQALQTAPESAYLYHLQGHLNRDRGDVVGAIASFEKALGLRPGDLATVQPLALAYGQQGDGRKIRQLVERVRWTTSLDVGGLLFLAEIAGEGGHYDQARACVEAALERDPDNIDARLQSASLAALVNDFSKARAEYERVLELDPENEPAREMIAWIASTSGLKRWSMRCALWIDRNLLLKNGRKRREKH